MTKEQLIAYVSERYSADPEYPWNDGNFIFRHQNNRKWFAVVQRIPYGKLGLRQEGETDILNLKCSPLMSGAYRPQPGVFPGYHMNKDHWLTLLLDGTAGDELIRELLEISFDATNTGRRRRRERHEV